MSMQLRTVLALLASAVYLWFVIRKAIQIRKSLHPSVRSVLRFDFIRMGADWMLLLFFLLSEACPAWFGLFQSTALGTCTGWIILISITLLISVFVDWIPIRKSYLFLDKKPSFRSFLKQQFLNILRIIFSLVLIWLVFLILDPVHISPYFKTLISILVLTLYRIALWFIQKHGKKKN